MSTECDGDPGTPGPVKAAEVDPNGTTTGVPRAAAKCIGPVSPPIKSAARRVSDSNCPMVQATGFASPSLAFSTAAPNSASASPGPTFTIVLMPSLASAFATSP